MEWLDSIKLKLMEHQIIINQISEKYKLESIKIYGYVLKNCVGATNDVNFLIDKKFDNMFTQFDFEDVDRIMLKNELINLLNLDIGVNTINTLENSLPLYCIGTDLKEKILEACIDFNDFINNNAR